MSLRPAENCQEGVQQYCGYGYDKKLYSSYDDCINKKMKECPPKTIDSGGYNNPIDSSNPKGGGGGIPEDHTNDNNPRKDCAGGFYGDFRFHCWRKEAQVGFGLGSALFLGYGIYNKKSTMSIIGLTLLGGLGGIIASSMMKNN
jgi:hypothetical protein